MLTVSVVVAAYTLERWDLLRRCLDSIQAQTVPVLDVVLCIDNNEELFLQAYREWDDSPRVAVIRSPDREHVLALENHRHTRTQGSRRRFGAGSARHAAIQQTRGEIVAIIDDDAWAEADWLERLLEGYREAGVVAVGGAPVAAFQTARPAWLPRAFDWTFGCEYDGLPTIPAPTRRLIGANLSVRREAYVAVGGFNSIDFEDLDLCMRLLHAYGTGALRYVPAARVHHAVPANRVTWGYFWRRCLNVNIAKAEAFGGMAEAANLNAEIRFALRTATLGVARQLGQTLRGDADGLRRAGAILAGLALGAIGTAHGRLSLSRIAASRQARA